MNSIAVYCGISQKPITYHMPTVQSKYLENALLCRWVALWHQKLVWTCALIKSKTEYNNKVKCTFHQPPSPECPSSCVVSLFLRCRLCAIRWPPSILTYLGLICLQRLAWLSLCEGAKRQLVKVRGLYVVANKSGFWLKLSGKSDH